MKNHILISHARSGTNFFLGAYSGLFPKNVVLKEIFRKKGDSLKLMSQLLSMTEEEIYDLSQNDPVSLWQLVCKTANKEGNLAICKIFYPHKKRDDPLWQHFCDEDKIMHLIRRNPFNTLVSVKLAKATNSWQSRNKEDNSDIKFRIEPDEIEAFKAKMQANIDWIRGKCEGSDYVEIYYENLGSSINSCAAEIVKNIDIENFEEIEREKHLKQNQLENSIRVENYQEVQKYDKEIF